MRVVVTGATGNVGSAVMRALVADPQIESVVGIARRLSWENGQGAEWHAADIRDQAAMREAFIGADAVIHLAWAIQPSRDRDVTHSINVGGSRMVFTTAAEVGVETLVHASSVGVYGRATSDKKVDESYPRTGISTSFYSVDKAEAERCLDEVEAKSPDMRIVRLRPGLIFQRSAASEIRRLFAGPLLPNRLVRPDLVPLLPNIAGVRFQAVHADDVAEAYRLAVTDDNAVGAFNIAADDVLDLGTIAEELRARTVPVPYFAARAAASVAWRARLTPTPPGWLDLASRAPLLSTQRAMSELGWGARLTGRDTLRELLEGMREGAGGDTPPLAANAGGPLRVKEFLSGVGASRGLFRGTRAEQADRRRNRDHQDQRGPHVRGGDRMGQRPRGIARDGGRVAEQRPDGSDDRAHRVPLGDLTQPV